MAASFPKIAACAAIVLVSFAGYYAEASIGLNWGRQNAQRLVPSQVVDLLLQNGIGRARVYNGQIDMIKAFTHSGINLTISVNVADIKSKESAKKFIEKRKEYLQSSNVMSVYFNDHVFYMGSSNKSFLASAMKALHWMQEALNEREVGHIKANFLNDGEQTKKNVTRPSECEFLDEIKPEMTEFVEFLRENNAPFLVEHTPLINVEALNKSIEFAFPDNTRVVVHDGGGVVYSNMVEWRYDCYLWALKKINASDIKVHFSMLGWPTDGYPGATAANAERFYKHLLPWVTSNKGTPMRPGVPIEVNIHALADEHKLKNATYARHWGIYRSNGSPKYKIDLSGQGRDIYPTMIKGIMRMPKRWCVFDSVKVDMGKAMKEVERACLETDCTSMEVGGSCSQLSPNQKVSYVFNMYFQYKFQNETACDFGGLGQVTTRNPSTTECLFPVEVVKGQQVNFISNLASRRSRPSLALFLVWLSILGLLV